MVDLERRLVLDPLVYDCYRQRGDSRAMHDAGQLSCKRCLFVNDSIKASYRHCIPTLGVDERVEVRL